ncbi:NAD(P)-dependent alcohol dehydrogenase [Caldiplasma sukawensis]
MLKATGYAVKEKGQKFERIEFERRDLDEKDVLIRIEYCGICHSDIHTARDEWGGTRYPVIPGHEIVGIVEKVGSSVKKFKPGDRVGVGCMVDSCGECDSCKKGYEQYCRQGATFTYNSRDKKTKGITYGGYSDKIVVTEDFVLKMPENLDFAASAPLLCAGITTYSPLKFWKAGPGMTVGVAGLGGLGHMAVKIGKAMGSRVVVFTTSEKKVEDAKKLGADDAVLVKDKDAMKKYGSTIDIMIDTIPAVHDLSSYLQLLALEGVLVFVGLPEKGQTYTLSANNLVHLRRSVAGSNIGGIPETQEMLDFCGKHNIVSDIELITPDRIDEAYERTVKSDVKYRFVIKLGNN